MSLITDSLSGEFGPGESDLVFDESWTAEELGPGGSELVFDESWTVNEQLKPVFVADIDDCSPNPCLNGAKCFDELNAFSCACAQGFEGKRCETSMLFYISNCTALL